MHLNKVIILPKKKTKERKQNNVQPFNEATREYRMLGRRALWLLCERICVPSYAADG